MADASRVFPRTERAIEAGHSWAGIWAAEQFAKPLAAMQPKTRQLLKPCLTQLSDAVESLCPLAVEASPSRLDVAYGPNLAAHDILVIAASRRHAVGFAIESWPEHEADAPRLPTPVFWGAVARCIDARDVDGILDALAARFDAATIARLTASAARVLRDGFNPAAALLAGARDESPRRSFAAGAFGIVALPPGIEVQLAEPEGTA